MTAVISQVIAPTGSGKTVTLELCMLRLLSRHLDPNGKSPTTSILQQYFRATSQMERCAGQWCLNKGQFKVVYVAPTKALIQERVNDWSKRFGHLELSVVECTGDSTETMDLTQADVIATTPCVMATALVMLARIDGSQVRLAVCFSLHSTACAMQGET